MAPSSMTDQTFLVLSALAGGPAHGYALISEVSSLSGGETTMRVGTLYGILDRLNTQQLIEVDHEEVVDSRLRRYYRLATSGVEVLRTEATRRQEQAAAALSRVSRMQPGLSS